jgi:hypothetical protein
VTKRRKRHSDFTNRIDCLWLRNSKDLIMLAEVCGVLARSLHSGGSLSTRVD